VSIVVEDRLMRKIGMVGVVLALAAAWAMPAFATRVIQGAGSP
jgi:hypothetical protein